MDHTPAFAVESHNKSVKSVAFSADGKRLASGAGDDAIQLYDLGRMKAGGMLMEHSGGVTALAFHRDGFLLSGSSDHSLCLWRTKDWALVKTLRGHKGPVAALGIHPSGKLALSVDAKAGMKMWNLLTGRPQFSTKTLADTRALVWAPSGLAFAVLARREVRVTDAEDGSELMVYQAPTKAVLHDAVFLSDVYLAVAVESGAIVVFDILSGNIVSTLTGPHKSRVRTLATFPFNPEAHPDVFGILCFLVSASSDGSCAVWAIIEDTLHSGDDDDEESEGEVVVAGVVLGEIDTGARITCMDVGPSIIHPNAGPDSDDDDDEGEGEEDEEEMEGVWIDDEESGEGEEESSESGEEERRRGRKKQKNIQAKAKTKTKTKGSGKKSKKGSRKGEEQEAGGEEEGQEEKKGKKKGKKRKKGGNRAPRKGKKYQLQQAVAQGIRVPVSHNRMKTTGRKPKKHVGKSTGRKRR